MSYPYTKPQSRYGYRRGWGDPRTGLVGSGPGRPLRRYSTDNEVGLPMGATQETPVSDGIFNVGPASGFSRGVFTPNPPWATPRYIASMPDGVSGFGAFGVDTKCGIPELVEKLTNKFPTVSISLPGELKWIPGVPSSLTFTPAAEIVVPIVNTVLNSVGTMIAPYAQKGANALADFLAEKLATPIANAIVAGASVPDAVKKVAPTTIKGLVNTTLRSKLIDAAKDMMACLGVEEPVAQTYAACVNPTKDGSPWGWENGKSCKAPVYPAAVYCTQKGLKAVEYPAGNADNPYQIVPAYRCAPGAGADLKTIQAEAMRAMDQINQSASQKAASSAAMASLTTLAAEKSKCASAGGQWYPGGADCDTDTYGNLINCKPATAATIKKYYCVPQGTPVAAASGASNLPLILGAAAVAALLLTRL